jgi:serine/threonine protein kinase
MPAALQSNAPRVVGRYVLYGEIASGGMATVHFGRLIGPAGFARPVAIKRLHAQFARDPDFVKMFLDEARLAARIAHPNVVSTLDVVAEDGEVFLVMEYVPGTSLGQLVRTLRKSGGRVPQLVAVGIVSGVLQGLQAAHEARDDRGERLDLVHRDVSPQNVLVGTDGVARLLDFGVAKASGRLQTTRDGQLKGKLAYMAPEQVRGDPLTRRTDVYAASVVLWEALTGKRLFYAENEASVLARVLCAEVPAPSAIVAELPRSLDRVVLRGLDRDPTKRYASAREMATDLDACIAAASPAEIGDWVQATATDELRQRAAHIAEVERSASELPPPLTSSLDNSGVGPAALAVAEMRSHVWGRPTDRPSQAPPARRAGEISQVSSLSLAQATERPGPRTSTKAVSTLLFSTSAAALLVGLIVFSQTRATSTTAAPATLAPAPGAIGLTTAPSSTLGGPGLVHEVPSSASARFLKPPLPLLGPTNARPTAPVPESRPQPASSDVAAPIAAYPAAAGAVAAPAGIAAGGHAATGAVGMATSAIAAGNVAGNAAAGNVAGNAAAGNVAGGNAAGTNPTGASSGAAPVGTVPARAAAATGTSGTSLPTTGAPPGGAPAGTPSGGASPPVGPPPPAGTATGSPPAGYGAPGSGARPGAPGGTAPAAAGSGTAAAEDCNPAYTLDAKGHRHFKPSCL